jgi:hypothetical protein
MGIKLKDHIIMGSKTHFSFLEQGMLIAIDRDNPVKLKTVIA